MIVFWIEYNKLLWRTIVSKQGYWTLVTLFAYLILFIFEFFVNSTTKKYAKYEDGGRMLKNLLDNWLFFRNFCLWVKHIAELDLCTFKDAF